MSRCASIILAAGQGTRMKSKKPKVLQELLDKPMLEYVVDAAEAVGSDPIMVVIGFGGEQVMEALGDRVEYVWQREQLGTGHAVMMAKEHLAGFDGDVLILYGDTPLLSVETLSALVKARQESGATAAVLIAKLDEPGSYGRIIRDAQGNVCGIVEAKDATAEQKLICEVNTGIYVFESGPLLKALERITPVNAQGEYYLTDVIKILVADGFKVTGMVTDGAEEIMGPNDRIQLAQTEAYLRQQINRRWMLEGVTIVDPESTYIGSEVTIGRDTTIYPGTFLNGKTVIGEDCVIGPYTRIVDSTIGNGTEIQFSQIMGATIGPDNQVGPYAYIRPGTVSEATVKFGDFVEVKNCRIASGSKVPHLTYLGDADVGANVNIGAGAITCNYDGVNKHRTIIKDNAFVGSNANLVAPVTVGAGATIAAGSTITKEVPDGALAVARSRQEVKVDWRSPKERVKKTDN